MRDLVIAGGGPVGLVTAILAARSGLDVTVRERRGGVLDKACGEGLMPGAVQALAALGIHPDGHRIAGIRYVGSDREAEAPFRRGPGLGVRRTTLHATLLAAAVEAGVRPVVRPVGEIVDAGDHLVVDGEPTRFLVGADGLHSRVRRLADLEDQNPRYPRAPRRFGLRAHVATAPWSDFVEVHWAASGEAYVTPVGPRSVGIAVLSSSRRPMTEHLADYPALAAHLAGLELSRVLGAGPLRQVASAPRAGRVLLVGDASGYVDALTGEGMAVGLAHAHAAVEAIREADLPAYDRAWRRIGRRHDLLTRALLGTTRVPLARRRIVTAAALAPRVFSAVVDQLARPA